MAYNRSQARNLCNTVEYDLFAGSLTDTIKDLTAAQLRSRIKRTRTLRDKNADLFRRQTVAIRATTGTRRGASGMANQRTEQKAQLFDQALKRFEARLAQLEAQAARAEAASQRAVASRKAAAKPALPTRSPKAPARPGIGAPGKLGKGPGPEGISATVGTRGKAIMGHLRASNERHQARRDGR